MSSIVDDIVNDPGEYLPVLSILGAILLFWGGLCWSGVASLRARTRRRRFWLAFAPVVLGFVGVWAHLPVSMESDGTRLSVDLRWFFLVPLLLGVAGNVLYWKTSRESPA